MSFNNQLEFEDGGEEDFQQSTFDIPIEEQPIQNNNNLRDASELLMRLSCACRHPITCACTLGVKLFTMAVYLLTSSFLFGSWISFSTRFVIIILLVAVDFWIVKNISGRLLVGLRYWNQVDENGKSQWLFEAREDRSNIDLLDSYIFWGSLYIWPLFWVACTLLAIFTFSITSFLIIFFALAISVVNAYGYTKCLKDARQRITSTLMTLGAQGYMAYLSNRFSNG